MRQCRKGVILSRIQKVTADDVSLAIQGIKQDIRNWHQNRPSITKIYIGKTSADKKTTDAAYDAMAERIDTYKRQLRITEIKLLYISTQEDIDEAERQLIDYNILLGETSKKTVINEVAEAALQQESNGTCYMQH